MPLLEAFLALALTMLSLATIATVGVEIIHRLVHFRGKDLRRMLQIFYDNELEKIVNAHFDLTVADKIDEKRQKVIDALIRNPLVQPEKTLWLGRWFKDLPSLSTEDMMKRLAHTDVGKAIGALADKDEVDALLNNALAKYEDYGKAASDLFKRRAQFVSLIAGVVVAFALNVDALYMFKTYLNDQESRAAVIANAESITKTWEKVADKVNTPPADPVPASSTEVPTTGLEEFADHPKLGPAHVKALEKMKADLAKQKSREASAAASDDLKAVQSDLASIKQMATDLQNRTSAPLGYRWTVVPATLIWPEPEASSPAPARAAGGQTDANGKAEKTPIDPEKPAVKGTATNDPECNVPAQAPTKWGYLVLWALRVLATGLLIGLGGPFWFNIVKTLMSVRGGGKAPSSAEAATAPQTPKENETKLKENFVALEKAARVLDPSAPPPATTTTPPTPPPPTTPPPTGGATP